MNKPYRREELEQKQNYEAQRKASKQSGAEKQHPERAHKPAAKVGDRRPERHG